MTPLERLHEALRSPDPARALRATVLSLSAEGQTQSGVYGLLEELLMALRARADAPAAQEELILDVMDAISGWCHPSARLFADEQRG
jgi:hypothetical protein